MAIFSDSQATLSSDEVIWRLVGSLSTFIEVDTQNKMILAYVGHKGHKGDEEEDALAYDGTSMAMNDQELFWGVAEAYTKTSIK